MNVNSLDKSPSNLHIIRTPSESNQSSPGSASSIRRITLHPRFPEFKVLIKDLSQPEANEQQKGWVKFKICLHGEPQTVLAHASTMISSLGLTMDEIQNYSHQGKLEQELFNRITRRISLGNEKGPLTNQTTEYNAIDLFGKKLNIHSPIPSPKEIPPTKQTLSIDQFPELTAFYKELDIKGHDTIQQAGKVLENVVDAKESNPYEIESPKSPSCSLSTKRLMELFALPLDTTDFDFANPFNRIIEKLELDSIANPKHICRQAKYMYDLFVKKYQDQITEEMKPGLMLAAMTIAIKSGEEESVYNDDIIRSLKGCISKFSSTIISQKLTQSIDSFLLEVFQIALQRVRFHFIDWMEDEFVKDNEKKKIVPALQKIENQIFEADATTLLQSIYSTSTELNYEDLIKETSRRALRIVQIFCKNSTSANIIQFLELYVDSIDKFFESLLVKNKEIIDVLCTKHLTSMELVFLQGIDYKISDESLTQTMIKEDVQTFASSQLSSENPFDIHRELSHLIIEAVQIAYPQESHKGYKEIIEKIVTCTNQLYTQFLEKHAVLLNPKMIPFMQLTAVSLALQKTLSTKLFNRNTLATLLTTTPSTLFEKHLIGQHTKELQSSSEEALDDAFKATVMALKRANRRSSFPQTSEDLDVTPEVKEDFRSETKKAQAQSFLEMHQVFSTFVEKISKAPQISQKEIIAQLLDVRLEKLETIFTSWIDH